MKKILVLGYGRSGKAAEKLARKLGYEVEVREDFSTKPGEAAKIGEAESKIGEAESKIGEAESLPLLNKDVSNSSNSRGKDSSAPTASSASSAPRDPPAFAVVSPGVPLTSPLIAECREKGIPLKSELQLGCEELKRQGWKLLAVTGSKGKSSVVKVVADAINLAGMHAVACGNYGLPVSEVAVSSPDLQPRPSTSRWAVVEVSSFMMETTELPADTFEAAVILNLQEDHLDRHGSVETYHALKRKLLTMAKTAVIGVVESKIGEAESFPLLNKDVANSSNSRGKDSSAPKLFAGSYFDNDILRTNARCAVALMRAAGLNDANITAAFREFVPLPHRMNRVATIDGIEYIDDSKATSLAALEAGVRMSWPGPSGVRKLVAKLGFPWRRRVLLIAGGLPKGDDPKSAVSILTERVKKVYLIGQSAEAFALAWKSYVDCEICGTMEAAVAAAKREAAKGDKVLLSPGTASFDQFKSFGERGDVFARLVKKEK